MIAEALNFQQDELKDTGVAQNQGSTRSERAKLPALRLEKVKKQRQEHKELLQKLFPKPVRLQRLIKDIENSFATQFASIIGSVDFAEARLAGFLSALKELHEKIEQPSLLTLAEIQEFIEQDPRIHHSFEELIFECAKCSLEDGTE